MRTLDIDGATMTLGDPEGSLIDDVERVAPGLTIAWHPDVSRIGERLPFEEARTAVSRLAPLFSDVHGRRVAPLTDPYVSRTPVAFERRRDGGVTVEGAAIVGGQPLEGRMTLSPAEVQRGVTIELGRRVLLLVHPVPLRPCRAPRFGLVGESVALRRLRTAIARVAPTDAAVLVRGESGSGKELVARAVHDASRRAAGPYRAVNVAAVPPSVAASSFFGHTKGAFSGAAASREGYFGESDGGTLFLDEIGDLPIDVQPLLLRALESGEIQPVGARRSRQVDVRIVAATDAALEAAIDDGRFSVPLLHRLSGLELLVAPLRARPDDIARLLLFALRKELGALNAIARLEGDPTARRPWLDARTVGLLMRHPWPGNVRELLNVARQIAVAGHDQPRVRVSAVAALDRMRRAQSAAGESTTGSGTDPGTTGADDAALEVGAVLEALREAGWSVHATARALGVAKTTLYRFIDTHRLLRKASEIPDDELRAVYADCDGDRQAMSDRLRVSTRALAFRLKELDPPPGDS